MQHVRMFSLHAREEFSHASGIKCFWPDHIFVNSGSCGVTAAQPQCSHNPLRPGDRTGRTEMRARQEAG